MLELFSRAPDVLTQDYDGHLTPMPIDEEISSLSAIILDDDCYHFINEGKQIVDDLPLIGAEYMIPLKASACLDMVALKERGVDIQSSDIRKHRNDIVRLYQLLTQDTRIELPKPIIKDMRQYLDRMDEEQIDVKGLGWGE